MEVNGITLVALVVTIIIIIILSTVTINMALGDNGLIKQAQLARDMTANVIVSENEDTNRVMQEFANVMADDGEGGESILVTSVSVSPTSITLTEGATSQLTATILPDNASNKGVTWSSDNPEIASVNSSTGLVTARTAGSATITATATDESGKKGTCSVTVETAGIPIEDVLEAGDWVRYPSAQGDIDCVVLYDSSSEYGVEIIAMESVKDVTLGDDNNFTTSMNSYNSAISTLNLAASDYNNSTYSSRARCVGSDPSAPTVDNPGYFTSSYSYMEDYNGQFKNQDTHYTSDLNQMDTLGIRYIDDYYWLASRGVGSYQGDTSFGVRCSGTNGGVVDNYLCRVSFYGGGPYSWSSARGLRPVFYLRPNIKITGGTGEEGSPYALGT